MAILVIKITALVALQMSCLAQSSRVVITRAVIAVILVAPLSGCILLPMPFPTTIPHSQPVPDVTPGLPQDLLSRDDEVLVLVQSRVSKSKVERKGGPPEKVTEERNLVNAPLFMRGKELNSLNETLKMESSSGYGTVRVIPLLPIGTLGGEVDTYSTREKLERLCVVAKDGRIIAFMPESLPDGKERLVTETETLTTMRRNVIVSPLRDTMIIPFEWRDGPCGISGEVNWPKETLSRTIDFLSSVHAILPVVEH